MNEREIIFKFLAISEFFQDDYEEVFKKDDIRNLITEAKNYLKSTNNKTKEKL